MTNIFRKVQRIWCADCEKRCLHNRRHAGVCDACFVKAWEQDAKDQEMRSLRGYSDEERARI